MVLNDREIEEYANDPKYKLIDNEFSKDQLRGCRYNLRAGAALSPDDGFEIKLNAVVNGAERLTWSVKPSETLMIMTKESVNVPETLMATYGQLNRWAEQGLMLVNASIVEPGYKGYLSCFFVNFSKKDIEIKRDDDIAKLCFYRMTPNPNNLSAFRHLTAEQYKTQLSISAKNYPTSFMNVGAFEKTFTEIEQRVNAKVEEVKAAQKNITENVTREISKSITWGGIILVLLVGFSTIEPIFHKWIYERTGLMTDSADLQKFQKDVLTTKQDLDKAKSDLIQTEHEVSDRVKTGEDKVLADRMSRLEKAIDSLNKSLKLRQK